MKEVGVIGVGHIGKGLVDKLRADGYPVTVFDVADAQNEYAIEQGASAVDSPAAVARHADVVIMALPGSPEVESTMAGEDGLLTTLEAGDLVIDVTTTHPETSVACAEFCADRDVDFVEAPITGGSPREGMHMMAGGTEESYEAASPILDVLCADHIRVGEVGSGTILKLGLQMRYAGHHALDAEIVEFVRDNGVEPELFNDFLEMGIWEQYISRDFSPDIEGLGGLAIWHKDIGYARDVAHENGTALPLNGVVHEAYKATVRRAGDDEGHAATLLRYWEALNDADGRGA